LRRAAAWLAAALLLPSASAGAEVRVVEALGFVPLSGAPRSGAPPRDAALRVALEEAVWRVASAEIDSFDPESRAAEVRAALGDQPLDYASRFRIVEDRGERPARFSEDPSVETEYVVLVEASVDVDRVRRSLRRAGLLGAPTGEGGRHRVRLELIDCQDYATYQAVRALLDQIGVRSALPVEMEAGRAVLEVEGPRPGPELLEALVRGAPPELEILPLSSDADTARLQARRIVAPTSDTGAAAPEPSPGAIDTPESNRY
jgi:hypothetical protein